MTNVLKRPAAYAHLRWAILQAQLRTPASERENYRDTLSVLSLLHLLSLPAKINTSLEGLHFLAK